MMDVLRQQKILKRLNNEESVGAVAPQVDIAEQIQKLNGLKEAGILSDEEFNAKKAELLAKM